MLTRFEVDGFKNLLDVKVDFGPFNCIAGPNGVGKSNLFDAIRFLSLLADHPVVEAASMIRSGDGESADIRDIFWRGREDISSNIRISAEMIVPQVVRDELGSREILMSQFFRYEVVIGQAQENTGTQNFEPIIISEDLYSLNSDQIMRTLRFHNPRSTVFGSDHLILSNRNTYYVRTNLDTNNEKTIYLRGPNRRRKMPALSNWNQQRSVLSVVNDITLTPILAVRQEMQRWRFIALEPSAMRKDNKTYDSSVPKTSLISEDGRYLAATFNRLVNLNSPTENDDPIKIHARIRNKLIRLVPSVQDIKIDVDERRQILELQVKERNGSWIPAHSLSDGTLRFLALAILSEDYTDEGIYCIEEPENGIHPGKIEALLSVLKSMVVDPAYPLDSFDNPLRQVIIATHSPTLVQLLELDDVIVAQSILVKRGEQSTRTLRLLPLSGTWRDTDHQGEGLGSVITYLTTPQDAPLPRLLEETKHRLMQERV